MSGRNAFGDGGRVAKNDQGGGTGNEITVPSDGTGADFTVPDDGAYGANLEVLKDGEVIARADANINQDPSQPDTTPPWLVGGKMDGDRAILYFSEPLNESVTVGHFHPYVQFDDCWCSSGEVIQAPMQVSDNKVTVDFQGSVRAVEGLGTSISYWVEPGDTVLRDLAGYEVRTPNVHYDGSKSTRIISLHNITGRPKILPVTVGGVFNPSGVDVSSNAGDDRYYLTGESIEVTLTFSEAVNVTGTPRVKIDLDPADGGEKWADYTGGSGTERLAFAYTVAAGNSSAQGVAVLRNTLELNGGTIRSASALAEENARLGHGGLGHDLRHRIVTPSSAAPVLAGASVAGTTLTLTFSEALGAAGSLASSAFTVKKTPQGGSEETVSLSGSPAISGTTVGLTLANAVQDTDTGVKVSYARPGSGTNNKLVDTGGAEVADFTDKWVMNDLDVTQPTLVSGEIESVGSDEVVLTIYFSEPLDEHSSGPGDFYRLNLRWSREWAGWSYTINPKQVTGSGNKVVVRFTPYRSQRPGPGQVVEMHYIVVDKESSADRLRDISGNAVSTPYRFLEDYWDTRTIRLDNLTQ